MTTLRLFLGVSKAAMVPASTPRASTAGDLPEIYDQFADDVWTTLQRLGVDDADLDDACQEVFLVVHRKRGEFSDARGTLGGWIYGIASNVAHQFRQRRARRREVSDDVLREEQSPTGAPDAPMAHREEVARVERLLSALDPDRRDIFVRVEIEEQTCEEVALATGLPIGTVWSRLHRARAQFAAARLRDDARASSSIRQSPTPEHGGDA